MMPSSVLNLASTIECPKCGKKFIVISQRGMYQCLNCDFERSLSLESTRHEQGGLGQLIFAIAGFLVTAALIL